MKNKSDSHTFAFFYTELKKNKDSFFTIEDRTMVDRIAKIVRLSVGEEILFFNANNAVLCVIESIEPRKIRVKMVQWMLPKKRECKVTVVLPLLKRVALEEAVYGCVEAGVDEIQLLETQKSRKKEQLGILEKERLERIVIAACEQSKHFSMTQIKAPVAIDVFLSSVNSVKTKLLFADPEGIPLRDVLSSVRVEKKVTNLFVLVGPEGDLTMQEKKLVYFHGAQGVRLTPTILRAQQAAVVLSALVTACVFE